MLDECLYVLIYGCGAIGLALTNAACWLVEAPVIPKRLDMGTSLSSDERPVAAIGFNSGGPADSPLA